MIKIGLLGGPSSGKSTLAAALFAELKELGWKTEQVQEYAREFINKNGAITNILNQYLLYEKQSEKESIVPETIEYLITDSPTILSLIYAIHYATPVNRDHQQMIINLYEKFIKYDRLNYDYLFLLPSIRNYVIDGTRTQTAKEATELGNKIKIFLDLHNMKYSLLHNKETKIRVQSIIQQLKLYDKDKIKKEPHSVAYTRVGG